MAQNDNNNSFIKRFTNKISNETRGYFSGRYLSQNTKENALEAQRKISELANKKAEAREVFSENGSIKSKSRTINKRSFADATRRSRSDLIYLVRGKDRGRSAWHYVLIDKEKKEMFLAKSRTGSIDVADYGEILYSGWGGDPPQAIVDKINDEFGL